jgi:diketogulonate reductase-like aldo/keto reductase
VPKHHSKSLKDTVKLHNGVEMPWFGLGVFKVENGSVAADSILSSHYVNGYYYLTFPL